MVMLQENERENYRRLEANIFNKNWVPSYHTHTGPLHMCKAFPPKIGGRPGTWVLLVFARVALSCIDDEGAIKSNSCDTVVLA